MAKKYNDERPASGSLRASAVSEHKPNDHANRLLSFSGPFQRVSYLFATFQIS